MVIKFGTDGWRDIIGDGYTFDNVKKCTQAACLYLKKTNNSSQGIIIGYDTRFASDRFARIAAEVAIGNDINVLLCIKPTPTPVISYNIVYRQLDAGIIITASHNPPEWNGFKFKSSNGGSASQEIVDQLEANIADIDIQDKVKQIPLPESAGSSLFEYIEASEPYFNHLKNLVDLDAIKNAGLKVVVDPMFGSGIGYFKDLIGNGLTKIHQINGIHNPNFPGISQPEPIAHNLKKLSLVVKNGDFDVGLALDGDADRLGIVNDKGEYITTLQVFALLCLYLLEIRGEKGPIVRSLTMTNMIDKLAKQYGVKVFKTSVGFKYLAPLMIREKAIAAGEESGGYAFNRHIPERDGIVSGLFFLDMMIKTGRSSSELLEFLYNKVGPHYYDRLDVTIGGLDKQKILKRIAKSKPDYIANKKVLTIDTRDGFHFIFNDGHWLLVRFSGTEPLIRIYAEAEDPDTVQRLLQDGQTLLGIY